MKTFALFAALFLTSNAVARADDAVSAKQLTSLACAAGNTLGEIDFALDGDTVKVSMDGFASDVYRVDSLGNGDGAAYLNLTNSSGTVALVFPQTALKSGNQTVSGVMYVGLAAFSPRTAGSLGTAWAVVMCQVGL